MRDYPQVSLKRILEEDGEESLGDRMEGEIFGYLAGYIKGINAEHRYVFGKQLISDEDAQNIYSGILSSNSFVKMIPDNFTEDFPLDAILRSARAYVWKWFEYKRLFSNKKYAETTGRKK